MPARAFLLRSLKARIAGSNSDWKRLLGVKDENKEDRRGQKRKKE
jgi:hypothetical protein